MPVDALIVKNNLVGEFILKLPEKHGKRLLSSPEHDRHFVEHNLSEFLILILAYLISQNPAKKMGSRGLI